MVRDYSRAFMRIIRWYFYYGVQPLLMGIQKYSLKSTWVEFNPRTYPCCTVCESHGVQSGGGRGDLHPSGLHIPLRKVGNNESKMQLSRWMGEKRMGLKRQSMSGKLVVICADVHGCKLYSL